MGNSSAGLYLFRRGIISKLQSLGFATVCVAPYDAMTPSLLALGLEYHPIDFSLYGTNPIAELELYLRLRQLYKRIRLDFVFHYTIKPNLYGTFAAYSLGIPSIAVVAGLGVFPDVPSPWLRIAIDAAYKRAARASREIWFLNQHDEGYFEGRGWLAEARSRVLVSEGVDLDYYAYQPLTAATDRGRSTPVVLFAGRLLGRKGVRDFAATAQILQARGVPTDFRLLGRFEQHNPDAITLAEVDHWSRAQILTYVGATTDVRPYLADADVVVLPTTYREGVSRILLEAMATGRPIVTTDSVGAGELVEHGKSGFKVPPNDPGAIADALELYAAMSVAERERMGRYGRKICEEKYDERRVFTIYEEALYRYKPA